MARKPAASLPDVFARPGKAPSRGTPIEALPREQDAPMPAEPGAAPRADRRAEVSPGASPPSAAVPPAAADPRDDAAPDPVSRAPGTGDGIREAAPVTGAEPEPRAQTGPGAGLAAAGGHGLPSEPTVPAAVGASSDTAGEPGGRARSSFPADAAAPTLPPAAPRPGPVVVAVAPPEAATANPGPAPSPAADEPGKAAGTTAPSRDSDGQPPRAPAATSASPVRFIALLALGVSLSTPLWYDGALRALGLMTGLTRAQQEDALAIARHERRLRDVEQRLASTHAQLARAQDELLAAARRQEETAAWTRVMILARLAEQLRRGAPFATELAMLRAAGPGPLAPLVDRIGPYAAIGVPTNADLASDFRRVTDPVLRPGRGFNPMAWAATMIAWTPFGSPGAAPDPQRDLLRAAAAEVQEGRMADALASLRAVTGPYATLVAGWIADAEARAAADRLGRDVEILLRSGRP